jgi:predicted RecB family nuclease
MKSDLLSIPGIGKTFVNDFSRIGITTVADLKGVDPDILFAKLVAANKKVGHATSKNYLYVIRMAVYVANGGADQAKLKWSAWKD